MDSLRFERLGYRYPGSHRHALSEIDLALDGGLTLLAGDSGSGKSTLLRVCNGLIPHFHGGVISGSALVFGQDVTRTTTRRLARQVGFVFQDPELQAVQSRVERDVAFGLENLRVPPRQMRERVDEALEACGITELRGRTVATLSGGERQRLALAGVLAMRPSLLVFDEPLSQLDDGGALAVVAAMRAAMRRGAAVLVAEHRLHLLRPLATRSIATRDGRLVDPAIDDYNTVEPTAASIFAAMPEVDRVARPGAGWRLDGVTAGHGRSAVLHDVELDGAGGEVIALTGANGKGKTTLLRTIAGLLPPLAGTVRRDPGRVAYLPQNPTALLHRQTLRDEIAWTLRHDRGGNVDAVLSEFALTHVGDRYPRDLSTGERQRAALAAALAGAPALALLDEPTRGMDAAARALLCRAVQVLAHRGACVVLATHDDELAASIAGRVIELTDGHVRERRRLAVAAT